MGLNDLFLGFSALCDFNRILFKNIYFFQMLPIVVFGLVRLFSQIFQMSPKGPPFIFSYFSKEWIFKNSQMPPFTFGGTMRLTEDQKNQQKFQKKYIFFLFFPHVGFVEENTWHIEVLLPFFWALDMTPNWAVPGMLIYILRWNYIFSSIQPNKLSFPLLFSFTEPSVSWATYWKCFCSINSWQFSLSRDSASTNTVFI